MGLPNQEAALEFLDELREGGKGVRVFTHNDADGLTSAAVLLTALSSMGIPARVRVLPTEGCLPGTDVGKGPSIVLDMGSGVLHLLEPESKILVIDHHEIRSEPPNGVVFVNPRLAGDDKETSTSAVVYTLLRGLLKLEESEAPKPALVGAYGDNAVPLEGPRGTVATVERDGMEAGLVEAREPGYRAFGRATRPAKELISRLSGKNVAEELESRLGKEILSKPLNELEAEEERNLISEHVKLDGEAERWIGRAHVLEDDRGAPELTDPDEAATILNACGRHGGEAIGIALAMGKFLPVETARLYREEQRRTIREALQVAEDVTEKKEGFIHVRGGDKIPHSVIGPVSQMLCEERNKVVVGTAKMGDVVKVSIRVPEGSDVDAGDAASEAAEAVGGTGGGHERAAGAEIPAGRLDDFLKELSKRL